MSRNTIAKHFSLKDHLFNAESVDRLATLIKAVYPAFDTKGYVKDTLKAFPELELKARISHMAVMLEQYLPQSYEAALKVIERSLPAPLDPNKHDDDFGEFIFAAFGEFIARNGTKKGRVSRSLKAIEAVTQRFSMEDAIRSFINVYEDETYAKLQKWTTHKHYHVRRLVSEGTRPLLPWSKRIALGSERALKLLDVLYSDNTRYVTRSVANHVNDITKRDPELALKALVRWEKEGKQEEREWEWMKKHALRTLIKQGHKGAFRLLGHSTQPKVSLSAFTLSPSSKEITLGEALLFSCTLYAEKDERITLDYRIDFVKKNGAHKGKVFKIKKLELKKGETVTLQKRHRFVKDATTFTFYPGVHQVTLLLNGSPSESRTFIIR